MMALHLLCKGLRRLGLDTTPAGLQKLWLLMALFSTAVVLYESTIYLTSESFSRREVSAKLDSITQIYRPERKTGKRLEVSEKWIIIDNLHSQCEGIQFDNRFFKIGWTIAILVHDESTGDVPSKAISGCNEPACILLPWGQIQQELGHLATIRLLTTPARTGGYLFAMYKGVSAIIEMECQVFPYMNKDSILSMSSTLPGLLYNETSFFNSFQHFDYPRNDISNNAEEMGILNFDWRSNDTNTQMYYVQDLTISSIRHCSVPVQSVCTESKLDRLPARLNVAVGPNTFAPLDFGATLFYRSAFWWLFLPQELNQNLYSLFRSLWINGVNREFFINFSIYPYKKATWEDNSCPTATKLTQQRVDWGSLSHCMSSFTCGGDVRSHGCSVRLLQNIIFCLKIIHGTNLDTIISSSSLLAWIDDLSYLGLPNPSHHGPPATKVFKIKYKFNDQTYSQFDAQRLQTLETTVFKYMRGKCPKQTSVSLRTVSDWDKPTQEDTMLIIVLNYKKLFGTLPYLEYIHRQAFRYILYCGPNVDDLVDYVKDKGLDHVTYIEGLTKGWYFMYECVAHAMRLGMPVKGYLQIGDDILLNTWNFASLPRDRIWMPRGFSKHHLYNTTKVEGWYHWNSAHGKSAMIDVFNFLKNASIPTSSSRIYARYHDFAKRFLATYDKNIGLEYISNRATDIFYMPEVLRIDYLLASELFLSHNSFIEMAMPAIHLGLSKRENVMYLEGDTLWRENREKPWEFFNAESNYFIHPFKALNHMLIDEGIQFFCKSYLIRYESILGDEQSWNDTEKYMLGGTK